MDDLDGIYELVYADQVVKSAWSARKGTPQEIKQSFAQEWISPYSEFGFKALSLREDQTLLGLIGFQRHEPEEDTSWLVLKNEPDYRVGSEPSFIEVELTYALGRQYWGFGYATEMGNALIKYGFTQLGIRRIINSVATQNERSINLMLRLGFRIEANASSSSPGTNGILNNHE